MTESTPPEGTQLTLVQMLALRRSLTEKVLDKAASDPEWRQLLLDDPELAMREANFPEAQELEQQGPQQHTPRGPAEREVVGQSGGGGYGSGDDGGYGGGYGGRYGYGSRCRWQWSRRWGWYRTY
jgi:hypothetical protein